jgi:Flp pilus assembly protein TadG
MLMRDRETSSVLAFLGNRRMLARSSARRGGHRSQRGASTLEFGVIIPLLLILVVGTIDLGRGVLAASTLSYAVREGARYAAVRSDESEDPASVSDVRGVVQRQAGALDVNAMEVTVSWLPKSTPGAMVEVTGIFDFDPIVPLFGLDTIRLSSVGRMRVVN